ncbi:cation:proton antiporter [Cryptosporangium minutisporangium]|uniref:Cation:proton antiporter n=1 Tax=Cryptosporangium minutisporangium TaxID=113569 RepID=A0ABP6T6G8_9ACTN
MESADLAYAIVGVGALLAGVLPRLLEGRPLSLPIAFLGLGMLVFALPLDLGSPLPTEHPEVTTRLTEVGVIVALIGAGLKLDRPVGWRRWSVTWRLLLIAMPLTIALSALLGWWWAGLVPASALLLGAALAPTDPVLAADVQVGEPTDEEDSEDEVRFGLTSEAGLNDGLAFPFVYGAIALAGAGVAADAPSGWAALADWLWRWVALDVLWRVVIGVAVGLAVGWLLGKLFFYRSRSDTLRLADHAEGFLALAITFLAYGAAELVQGYGFLAVFVCAVSIRASERSHGSHQVLHDFAEQIERLLTVMLLLLFGGAVIDGLLAPLTWQAALVGVVLVFVLRPLAAWASLRGSTAKPRERWVIAFFGIRGIGSLYYVAYAVTHAEFPGTDLLWATVGFVVLLSVVVHGVAATPVMQWLDRTREGNPAVAAGKSA